MKEPLVSVHMITYNHAPFIREAIEGALQQKTNFPFELVIGDDCSTDGTRELLIEQQKRYPETIRLVGTNQNVGCIKNCYRTLKACRGKYVAFCEGDDYWHHPLKLQKQVDYMETHADCGMVHSSYDVYEMRSKTLIQDYTKHRKFKVPANPDINDIILRCRIYYRIQTCTALLLRNLYERIAESDPYLYQSGHFLMSDTQLWAEIALVSRIGYIPESLATYRLLNESASRSTDKSKAFRFELSHIEMQLYLCDKHKLHSNVRSGPESAWCYYSLRKAFHERNAELALTARRAKPALTWKEWLLYLGARSRMAHNIFRVGAQFRDRIVKKPLN